MITALIGYYKQVVEATHVVQIEFQTSGTGQLSGSCEVSGKM